jgi:hypothetical protein
MIMKFSKDVAVMKSEYDFSRGRWHKRPSTHRWSEMVLGKRATSLAFFTNGTVLVSCFLCKGRRHYSDPVMDLERKAGPTVLYRIRVKLKNHVSTREIG